MIGSKGVSSAITNRPLSCAFFKTGTIALVSDAAIKIPFAPDAIQVSTALT